MPAPTANLPIVGNIVTAEGRNAVLNDALQQLWLGIMANATEEQIAEIIDARDAAIAARDEISTQIDSVRSYEFVATSGQTVFTGADINTNTLLYRVGRTQVFRNGVRMNRTIDYTETNENTLTFAYPLTAEDRVNIDPLSFSASADGAISGASLYNLETASTPAGTVFIVDADYRLIFRTDTSIGSGASLYNLETASTPAGTVFIVDADYRLIFRNDQGGAADFNFDTLSLSQPADSTSETVAWRDGPYLSIRDPMDSLYTLPRTSWFTNLSTLYARYDDLVAEFPDYITRSSLGNDGIGNPIYQYVFAPPSPRITSPGTGSGLTAAEAALPKVILLSGVHGSERTSQMGNLIFASRLARDWQKSRSYSRIRWGSRLVIIPAACPSGVDASTRENHNGVDPNRNSDFRWDDAPVSAGTPFFKGDAPMSEAEVVILANLPTSHPDAIAVFDHHNHAESELVWFGNATESLQPRVNRLAHDLIEDVYRLGIRPDMPATPRQVWVSKAIAGNIVGSIDARGVPAMFMEEPASAGVGGLAGTVELHRLSENLALKTVTAALEWTA